MRSSAYKIPLNFSEINAAKAFEKHENSFFKLAPREQTDAMSRRNFLGGLLAFGVTASLGISDSERLDTTGKLYEAIMPDAAYKLSLNKLFGIGGESVVVPGLSHQRFDVPPDNINSARIILERNFEGAVFGHSDVNETELLIAEDAKRASFFALGSPTSNSISRHVLNYRPSPTMSWKLCGDREALFELPFEYLLDEQETPSP